MFQQLPMFPGTSEDRIKEGEQMKIYIGTQSPTTKRIKKIKHIKKLILDPKWEPLAKVRDIAPNVPGIYMMAFDKPIKYDKGISRVVYIGSSNR